jgi:hypothetical protein
VIVVSGVAVWAFKHFGKDDLALPLWSGIAALLLTVATKWSLRRRAWFWIAMSVLVAAHVPAVVLAVQWRNWVSVKAYVLLVLFDWLVMIWILGLVGKIKGERPVGRRPLHRPKPTTKS